MTTKPQIYYIPTNPNIPKGHIYTLYLNHNTNLDLSSIINPKTITLNNIIPTKEGLIQTTSQITISKEDYTRLLELSTLANQISTKRTNAIQTFIQAENQATTELTKINTERQELIKKLTKGKELH